jgi:hypothetical protein
MPHEKHLDRPATLCGSCSDFGYEADDQWAKLPAGWTWKEAAAVATDSKDRVFVFHRGEHPILIFNRDGTFLGSWGEGLFPTARSFHWAGRRRLLHR